MLRRKRHLFFTLALVFDVVMISAAWMTCYVINFHGRQPHPGQGFAFLGLFVRVMPIVLVCDVLALGFVGLYRPDRPRSVMRERMQIARGAALGWLFMLAALYYYISNPANRDQVFIYSRVLLGMFLFANPVALMVSRWVLRRVLRGLHGRSWGVGKAAIVGTGRLAQKALHAIRQDPSMGIEVEYFVGEDDANRRRKVRGVPVIGSVSNLLTVMQQHAVDSVFVAIPMRESEKLEQVLDTLAKLPVTIAVLPDFRGVVTLSTSVEELDGLPVIQLVGSPIQGWYAVAKRLIDVVGSLALLIVCGVPMLVLALLVKLTSAGPVLFRQVRMGLGGEPFTILKFRSMRAGAEEETGPVWASREDPRCTPLGRRMRRFSLDELPQLINVLRGDMSLVGPRPERPHFVQEFVQTLPAYMLRHNVKAGMTGWAQVNGLRGDTSLKKRLQYDLYYINNWSLSFDLFILLRTPFVGLIHRHDH